MKRSLARELAWAARIGVTGVVAISVVVLASSASGTASPTGDLAAITKCRAILPNASEYGTVTEVLRGESSTAAAVVNWQESRARKGIASSFRRLASTEPVTVCIFSGEFVTPAGPLATDRTPKQIPNTLRLLVYGTDQVVFDAAGQRAGMSPETPSDAQR